MRRFFIALAVIALSTAPAHGADWAGGVGDLPLPGHVLSPLLPRTSGPARPRPDQKDPPPSSYLISDLGTLGGSGSYGISVNDRGEVVGQSELTPTYRDFHAFLWKDGQAIDLGTLGYGSSSASDVNRHGQIVGYSQITPYSNSHACLWQDGGITDLGHLGIDHSFAEGINDHGEIAGWSWLVFEGRLLFHAWIWRHGSLTDLGSLEGPSGVSQAVDINERGQVVGRSSTPEGGVHPFLWQDGIMTDLHIPGGDVGSAQSINKRGQIVGGISTPSGTRAYLWEDGVSLDLGTLGGAESYALAINDRGQVVGTSTTVDGETHAFLWEDGVMTDLGGGIAFGANAINREGEVSGSLLVGGDFHAALWSPAPQGKGQSLAAQSTPARSAATSGLRLTSAVGAIPVAFEIPGLEPGSYTAQVFDVRGRLVSRWLEDAPRGSWDGRQADGTPANPGVYFLRVLSGGRRFEASVFVLR